MESKQHETMAGNLRVGRIAGIEISINWSCFVLVALLVWTLASGIFRATNPHLSSRTDLAMAIVATAGYFCSLLLHELGHAWQARREGMATDGITLWLFGGVSRFKGAFPRAGAEFRVALAGPVVSGLLGVLFVLLAMAHLPQAVHAVASWLGYLNVSLFAFNLFPALPLDGGRALHAVLWQMRDDDAAATRVAAGFGRVFGYLLVTAGLALLIFQGSFSGAWLAFLGWFLLEAAGAESRYGVMQAALAGLQVRDVMTHDPVTVSPDLSVGRLMDETAHERRYTTYPVVENGSPVGLLPFSSAARVPRRAWDERRVRDCMLAQDEVPVLAEDDTAIDALAAVSASDAAHAFVVSNGRLVGLLSVNDLARVLEATPSRRRIVAA